MRIFIGAGRSAAPAAAGGDEFRHFRLLVSRRVAVARRRAALLKEGHTVQAGLLFDGFGLTSVRLAALGLAALGLAALGLAPLGLAALGLAAFSLTTVALTVGLPMIAVAGLGLALIGGDVIALALIWLLAATAAFVGQRMIAAILLRLTTGLTLLLPGIARLLAFLAILAPTEVVALDEAALGLDHPVIVIGILPVGFGQNAITRGCRLAGQRLVLVENLVCIAANPDVGAAAIENLVSIGRAIGVVMLRLVMVAVATSAATAATTATAARPLTIVWSH